MRPRAQKQPQVKKELCRALDDVDVDKILDDWQKEKFCTQIDLSNRPGHVNIAYEPFKPEEEIRKKVEGKKTFMHLRLYTTDISLASERISEETLSFLFSLFSFSLFPFFSLLFISFFLPSLIP